MGLAERIRANLIAHRQFADLSPEKLAAIAWPDLDPRRVGGHRVRNIETGRRQPNLDYVDDLAAALGIDASVLASEPAEISKVPE